MNLNIDITEIILETEHLILRPFEKNDLNDFNEYARVPGVGEMAGWIHHQSIEESGKILEMFIYGKNTFAILDKISGKVIGSFGIEKYDEKLVGEEFKNLKCIEIGYVLSKDFWGRGYMTEAGLAVLKYCYEVLSLDAVFCGYFKRNTLKACAVSELACAKGMRPKLASASAMSGTRFMQKLLCKGRQ